MSQAYSATVKNADATREIMGAIQHTLQKLTAPVKGLTPRKQGSQKIDSMHQDAYLNAVETLKRSRYEAQKETGLGLTPAKNRFATIKKAVEAAETLTKGLAAR